MNTSPLPPSDRRRPAPDQPRRAGLAPAIRFGLALALVAGFAVVCVGLPAQATSLASSAASSAVDSLSASVGAFSNAVSGVSTSSSPGGDRVAQGEYRIDRTHEVQGAPGRVALDLQPTEAARAQGAQPWQLRLPEAVAQAAALESGQTVTVRERSYGFGLWRPGGDEPFYLVVHDGWAQALRARALDAAQP